MNLYNEIDAYPAAWLSNLIAAGHIAPGIVSTRDIRELTAADIAGAVQAHFFAGIGIWSHALRLANWPDDLPVWTGSCPCQPFSAAGKRRGLDDERHLWPAWFRLIRSCKPPIIFGEQVSSNAGLAWFDVVCDDLESQGYTVEAFDFGAASIGAPHIRQRLYFVAYASSFRAGGYTRASERSDGGARESAVSIGEFSSVEWLPCHDGKARPIKPGIKPLAYGHPNRVARLRAIGNAIVPSQAAIFIQTVMEMFA